MDGQEVVLRKEYQRREGKEVMEFVDRAWRFTDEYVAWLEVRLWEREEQMRIVGQWAEDHRC